MKCVILQPSYIPWRGYFHQVYKSDLFIFFDDVQYDKHGRLEALKKAMNFSPDDTILRHQYGVALSRVGLEREAIEQFSEIITLEEKRLPPRETLIMALTTRVINLRRLGRLDDANSDIRRARDLMKQYPHLAYASTKLDELDAGPD